MKPRSTAGASPRAARPDQERAATQETRPRGCATKPGDQPSPAKASVPARSSIGKRDPLRVVAECVNGHLPSDQGTRLTTAVSLPASLVRALQNGHPDALARIGVFVLAFTSLRSGAPIVTETLAKQFGLGRTVTFGIVALARGDVPLQRPRVRPPSPRRGMVYFIQAYENGAIKIGYTTNLDRRLAALQTATGRPLTLLGTRTGSTQDERALHRKFAEARLDGEWFRASEALLDEARR